MAEVAWLAYVPIPGLAWIAALVDRYDRFTRYHARQGGMLVGLLYIGLIALGLLGRISDASGYRTFIGAVSILWLLAGLAGVGYGIAASLRGRYARIRPVWDLLAAMGR